MPDPEKIGKEQAQQVLEGLILDAKKRFSEQTKKTSPVFGWEVPYYLLDAAEDAIREHNIKPQQSFAVLVKVIPLTPVDIQGVDINLDEHETWNDFLVFLGARLLHREMISRDSSLLVEDSRRLEKEEKDSVGRFSG